MCPHCKVPTKVHKKGIFIRKSDGKKVQRFNCFLCFKSFSTQTNRYDYRLRKRYLNRLVFFMLANGVSQRGCAKIVNMAPRAIACRVVKFGQYSEKKMEKYRKTNHKRSVVLIDEMESFEHSKLKPVTIPIAVEKGSRRIIALDVGDIAAKGRLAKASVKKYGKRICERKQTLENVFSDIASWSCSKNNTIITDKSTHYLYYIKNILKGFSHIRFKGNRGAIVGQGELKKVRFDPLFDLNQTYAMIRDHIKRLTRKTWCTYMVPPKMQVIF